MTISDAGTSLQFLTLLSPYHCKLFFFFFCKPTAAYWELRQSEVSVVFTVHVSTNVPPFPPPKLEWATGEPYLCGAARWLSGAGQLHVACLKWRQPTGEGGEEERVRVFLGGERGGVPFPPL